MKDDLKALAMAGAAAAANVKTSSGGNIHKPFPITMRTANGSETLEQDDAPTEVMERPTRESALANED